MGNTDSKLSVLYRDHVFKLARPDVELIYDPNEKTDSTTHNVIPLFNLDVTIEDLLLLYQTGTGTETVDHDTIFSPFYLDFISAGNSLTMELFNKLITHQELRFIYNINPTNFTNLLRFTALKIYLLANCLDTDSKEHLEQQLVQLLVCTRILTKIVPIFLEKRGNSDIFWTTDASLIFGDLICSKDSQESTIQPLPPLGALLIKACTRLLFVEGFTIATMGSLGSMTRLLWENGVSTQDCSYHNQTPKIDANRLEIINLLLALCSSDLFQPNSLFNTQKQFSAAASNAVTRNKFLYYLSTLSPEYDIICLTASIVNLTCRYCSNYHEESTSPYNNLGFKNSQQQQFASLRLSLVISSLQLLNLMCFNSWPRKEMLDFALSMKLTQLNDNVFPSNIALSFLAALTREFDLKLILASFARILKMPIDMAVEQESNPLSFPSRKPSSANSVESSNNGNHQSTYNNSNNNNNNNNKNGNHNQGSNNHSSANSNNSHNVNNDAANSKPNNSMALPQVPPLLTEVLIFFTNLVQNNKVFENYIADRFANKIVIFSVYFIIFYQDIPQLSTTLIPLCYNLALLLSSKKLVLSKMLEAFSPNYYTNKLPNFFKLSTGNINNITYRDFAIIHLCNAAISNARDNVQPRPWLFELIYNLLPIPSNLKDDELTQTSSKKHPKNLVNGGLSYNASMSILNLLSKLSAKNYLTIYASSTNELPKPCYMISPGFKLDSIALILRAISTYIILYFDEARNLSFALCRHQRVLIQIRDSIELITKALDGRADIEGVKIQQHDYYEYSMNPRTLANEVKFVGRGGLNGANKQELTTQNIIFDKSRNTAYQTDGNMDDSDVGLSDNTEDTDQGDTSDVESTNLELTKSPSNMGKTHEIFEQADFSMNVLMNNRDVFFRTRPKWPIGITMRSKIKKNSKLNLSDSWTGAPSLSLLIKVVKILLRRFPSITTITTTDYYHLLTEIGSFKEEFELSIKPALPIYIRVLTEIEPLKVDLSVHNGTYQQWLYMTIWADTFNSHSGFYSTSNSFTNLGSILNANNVINLPSSAADSVAENSTPTAPNLERWNSNGSGLSRTNSNGSSLMGYFASQNNDFVPNSPLDVVTVRNISSPKIKSVRNKPHSSEGVHSFFNFSWTGFNKNDHYSPINEQGHYESSSSQANNSRAYIFTLDSGVLKPNTWAGTKIKLFNVHTEEKEEFSFLDMTSSLLKRFRIGSNASVTSLDTISTNHAGNANNGNGNNNPTSPLTPVCSSPRIPRDSAASNFSLFATPKQL